MATAQAQTAEPEAREPRGRTAKQVYRIARDALRLLELEHSSSDPLPATSADCSSLIGKLSDALEARATAAAEDIPL